MENQKKRTQEDLETYSPDLKVIRMDSESVSSVTESDRVESNGSADDPLQSGPELAEPAVDGLLNILDDLDTVKYSDSPNAELDSVVKSFEEEIFLPEIVTSDQGLVKAEMESGFLLEASDDELGLPPRSPPPVNGPEIQTVDLELSGSGDEGFGGMCVFDGQIPSFDSFEIGLLGD